MNEPQIKKRCSGPCKEWLPIKAFYERQDHSLSPCCRACHCEAAKQKRRRHSSRYSEGFDVGPIEGPIEMRDKLRDFSRKADPAKSRALSADSSNGRMHRNMAALASVVRDPLEFEIPRAIDSGTIVAGLLLEMAQAEDWQVIERAFLAMSNVRRLDNSQGG